MIASAFQIPHLISRKEESQGDKSLVPRQLCLSAWEETSICITGQSWATWSTKAEDVYEK
jgi:hypothetical protein